MPLSARRIIEHKAGNTLMKMPTSEFLARRQSLFDALEPNSVCVIAAASACTRSNDTEYAFRQNSDFWYLTGFNEPDAYLVLSNAAGNSSTIFVLPTDRQAEIWHGRRLGPADAATALQVDNAMSVDTLDDTLLEIIDGHQHLYYPMDAAPAVDTRIREILSSLRHTPRQAKVAPKSLHDLSSIIHDMRLIKSKLELEVMQHAIDISAKAHCRAMQFCHVGAYEYQLEAELAHEFAMHFAREAAYASIVGGGENACILHYTENQDLLHDGDLVLVDAGAEWQGYAADITRTFPVNGRFSAAQSALYQLVLDAQTAALAQLKPHNTISIAMLACVRVLVDGMLRLGILQGTLEDNLERETWRRYFMHGLGHWLGLDVHDVGPYKIDGLDRPLQANMVLTVEPGLYIPKGADVPEQYHGIGIRIEDDIVITASGHRVLSHAVPKQIKQIEALMRRRETL